jgi:peptidoglycan/LPS O-acetylase OafA/YrhL
VQIPDAARSTETAPAVDNTDWLKTAAIVLVSVDHFGHFFMQDDHWWAAFGRLAAPTFFFLIGYAQTRTVPPYWIWLGIVLTLLESWNAGWTWVAPNILLSFALVRLARPYVEIIIQRYGWIAFAAVVCALLAVHPIAATMVDYGAGGWLWALLGLCQRIYVDRRSFTGMNDAALNAAPRALPENAGLMRMLACFVAVIVYVWQEQTEFSFPPIHFAVFILGVGVLSAALCMFQRGPSRIQPTQPIAGVLRFIGRHTLEIYAIQLAGSELTVNFLPDLIP